MREPMPTALRRLTNASVAEVGIAVALGVLIDTLLVCTVLVPATFLAIGQRVWWPARAAQEPPSPPLSHSAV